ncbi:Sugar kinase of the NBD/HSP70 family, may contain an N-terminal HTH domain [Klenkia marina]|uniref:Sugar kinase of the NBD/HSP70 family, may contain an N-terminal HTH domain n=1 Tax=Klenkia marina TaxID=1960309 RepID=A0A1G4Y7S7_9ACTN|nr:ROK family protein [Klenkia marina]SCX49551.1 Sugar kinase of the NBD/HSP70 family, may contain an N-terminal HTH domain [Klenkia marina]
MPATAPTRPGAPTALVALVRSGRASSRAELARLTGASPTTVAGRVDELLGSGVLTEVEGPVVGNGRPPRRLAMSPGLGVVGAVGLGEQHADCAVLDATGAVLAERPVPVRVADGPDAVLATVVGVLTELRSGSADAGPLLGLGLGVPGPVAFPGGVVTSPARMPGWNGADVAALARPHLPAGAVVVVDNDANLMALGEHATDPTARHLVMVKAGSGIGCGIVVDGVLQRGARGFAGDISHVTVPDAEPVPCSCGRVGCLDAVASGSALAARLRADGVEVTGVDAVLDLARDAHPQTTGLLREAGSRTGTVLATIVNLVNPDRLVLGGWLSQAEAFVAGVRSAVYAQSPPLVTDGLEVLVSRAGPRAGLLGAGHSALDAVLADLPRLAAVRAEA